jgi:hypothetical protein
MHRIALHMCLVGGTRDHRIAIAMASHSHSKPIVAQSGLNQMSAPSTDERGERVERFKERSRNKIGFLNTNNTKINTNKINTNKRRKH